jgi:hypothetical protein
LATRDPNPFGDWPLMDRVRLRECEIRLRNADVLRGTLSTHLKAFEGMRGVPWEDVRPKATEIKVEAEALLDEYQAISASVAKVFIPEEDWEAEDRRQTVVAHIGKVMPVVEPILPAINAVIAAGDQRLTSSDPLAGSASSTSESEP